MIFLTACFHTNRFTYTNHKSTELMVEETISIDSCFKESIDVYNDACKKLGSEMVVLKKFYSCGDRNIGSLTLDDHLIGTNPPGYAKLLCRKEDRTLWYLYASYENPSIGIYADPNPIDVF